MITEGVVLYVGMILFFYILVGVATKAWKVVTISFVWLVGGSLLFMVIVKLSFVIGMFYIVAWAIFPMLMMLRGFRKK